VNAAYETALADFVTRTLDDREFTRDLEEFVGPLILPGRINSLTQTLLKLTLPGVPDLYQGSELWDLSLVDPDNRRPVDFEGRKALLGELEGLDARRVMRRIDEGLPKLWLTSRALRLRKARPAPFSGSYEPVRAEGARSEHVFAFARGGEVVSVAQRFPLRLGGAWGDTRVMLPEGRFFDQLSERAVEGGARPAAELFELFPVALLAKETG
jgi:(1->4)-alpha-D-glucan 1-alpha-D-glucosylmutase